MKILYIAFFVICILFSCKSGVFENDLSTLLNVEDVQILSMERIDVSGGLRKSYLMEVYELSPSNIDSFTNSKKILPENNEYGPWEKYGWSNCHEKINEDIKLIVLTSDWGDKKLGIKLDSINHILNNNRGYFAFYCKPTIEEPEYVQFFVLDTLKNTLYIMDSNM